MGLDSESSLGSLTAVILFGRLATHNPTRDQQKRRGAKKAKGGRRWFSKGCERSRLLYSRRRERFLEAGLVVDG